MLIMDCYSRENLPDHFRPVLKAEDHWSFYCVKHLESQVFFSLTFNNKFCGLCFTITELNREHFVQEVLGRWKKVKAIPLVAF